METKDICQIIQTIIGFGTLLAVVAGGVFTLCQYNKQQKFKRLQNLTAIWEKFMNEPELIHLFNLLDSKNVDSEKVDYGALEKFDLIVKIKFLGLLEEVSLYVENFEVDRQPAEYLFQWHFYYVFGNNKDETSQKAFWEDLGGIIEKEKPYWEKSYKFSKNCNPVK